jgi:HNH endonuclease
MSIPMGTTVKALVKLGKRPEDCWQWLGQLTEEGYAIKTVNGQKTSAARWMWSMLFGSPPKAMKVIHTCANPACVNPAHMRLGSQADAVRSGAGTTLSPADVAEIKRAKADRNINTTRILSERYGITQTHVRLIWKEGAWGKVGNPRPKRQSDAIMNSA